MKKKLLSVLSALMMLTVLFSVPVFAEENESVYVTIASAGDLVVKHEAVDLTDADKDGALTINDVLLTAHDKFFEGGADAGYKAEEGDYGLAITKLWGVENGGSYGYYVNNVAAMGLTDPVKAGDVINAYSYKDLEAWSDMYTYFNTDAADTKAKTAELVLSGAGFDADWNPVTVAVEGAEVKVNDKVAGTTDKDGKVQVTLEPGKNYITASSSTQVIVPPVAVITVEKAAPAVPVWAWILAAVIVAAVIVFVAVRKKNHEA